MYGNNPVRKADYNGGGTYWVQEVFHTLQGEGPDAGTPAVFVRLAGCNLRCWFCDTDFESSQWHPTRGQLVERVRGTALPMTRLVVLTGGEPLRQDVVPLIHELMHYGYRVQVETAGTLWPPGMTQLLATFKDRISLVVSPKTPKVHKEVAAHATAWKYIIRAHCVMNVFDGLPVMATAHGAKVQPLARPPRGAQVFVQPMDEGDNLYDQANKEAAVEMALTHGYRLSLQVHKIIGLE